MPIHPLRSRLREPALAQEGGASEADRALRNAILAHLRVMCGTRIGTMITRPDYGVPDVSEMVHSFPAALDILARSLKDTIEKYEPRLTRVRVRHIPSETPDLVVRFEITASMVLPDHTSPVRFETRTDASRRIEVT
ncbi:type VI secretion system baseplate subunit TssE [Pendulispora brunnea]|uniref:Type VI secretion system baseplate subunit TssE n=1 Tax=Pendulispora brunnea TaxID=2905690 RepID=A0ABZ2K058_9BACT